MWVFNLRQLLCKVWQIIPLLAIIERLLKELSLSLLNGIILSVILLLGSYFLLGYEIHVGYTVSIALLSVIIMASLIGTFIPIILNKYGVDLALATGPFSYYKQ